MRQARCDPFPLKHFVLAVGPGLLGQARQMIQPLIRLTAKHGNDAYFRQVIDLDYNVVINDYNSMRQVNNT